MAQIIRDEQGTGTLFLAPGFRFHPTDEEIITQYLSPKIADQRFSAVAMGEVDLNKCEPWDLPSKAKMGEKEFYFFTQKERRYPTGMRTNRATDSGYWKATGKDKAIYSGNILVGTKKTLVFYKGRAPKGDKTNWVMHEFRLEGSHYYRKDDWVVVRVFHKNEGAKKTEQLQATAAMDEDGSASTQLMMTNPDPNPFNGHPSTSAFGEYLLQYRNEAAAAANANNVNIAAPLSMNPFIGQDKIEQPSNSMVTSSRETGLSSDWNAEISSGPMFDLENIWKY